MKNEIAKSPEMLQKEAMVLDLQAQLKKRQSKLRGLKTRLKNTKSEIEVMQRKVQTETLRKMEEVDALRLEIAELALQLKKLKSMSKSDKMQLQMMADEMTREGMFGTEFEEYKARKEQMESDDFDFDEYERAKMQDMFEPFQVKPKEDEQKNIRKVYLKLSQKFHPDLAKGEHEAKSFHAMQQQINDAYKNNDIQALLELESIHLLEEFDFSAKAITVDVLQQEIDRLQRDNDLIEQQIKRTSKEVKDLRKSELGQMLTAMNKLEREGQGFDMMNADMDETIFIFTALRDGFKKSIELGHLSPDLVDMLVNGPGYDDDLDDDGFFESGNSLDLLMRMAEGDEEIMDIFSDFYEEEMEVENPKFPIGSSVRVRLPVQSLYDRKTNMLGWEGRVEEAFYNENEQVIYELSFDSLTMAQMPMKFIKKAIKQEEDFQTVELLEDQLEASVPRDEEEDAFAAYRKTLHEHQWAFLRNPVQEKRLKNILLAYPRKSDEENWAHYLEQHLVFPFNAKTKGAFFSDSGIKVKVLGMEDVVDEEYGQVVEIKIKGERNARGYLLIDLKTESRFDKNYQLLEDYFTWAKVMVLV